MDVIIKLQQLGYSVLLDGNEIALKWGGVDKPNPEVVKPLLLKLKAKKAEAIQYLAKTQPVIPEFCEGCWALMEDGRCCKKIKTAPCSEAIKTCEYAKKQ